MHSLLLLPTAQRRPEQKQVNVRDWFTLLNPFYIQLLSDDLYLEVEANILLPKTPLFNGGHFSTSQWFGGREPDFYATGFPMGLIVDLRTSPDIICQRKLYAAKRTILGGPVIIHHARGDVLQVSCGTVQSQYVHRHSLWKIVCREWHMARERWTPLLFPNRMEELKFEEGVNSSSLLRARHHR